MTIFSSLETFFFSVFAFIILMCVFPKNWISFPSKQQTTKKNLPPSPPRLPIIGNFHQIGTTPKRSLQALCDKYGPLMLLHLGSVPMLVASSVEAAKQILKTHDVAFSSRPSTLLVPNILFYDSKDVAFSPYGEYWRQLKTIVIVHLLSNARVKSFKKVREEEISLMIDVLTKTCGSVVDMGDLLFALSNNIVCRASVGRKYDDTSKLLELLKNLLKLLTVFTVGTYIPWLSWVDRVNGVKGRAKRLAKEIDEFLEGVLKEHENKKRDVDDANKSSDCEDFVDILLDVQRDNTTGFTLHRDSLKAIILDMFAAGTETTSANLEWTICELIKHPTIMKKLQQEVTEVAQGRFAILEEDLEKMHYLKAVIKESLRLHPPLPILTPRESIQDVSLMGYDIPSGTQLSVNAWAIGRDPSVWEEANVFKPERFLNNSIDYKGLNFEWLPFGAGRRGCPGVQYALVAVEHALANIVYKFDLSLPDGVRCEDLDMSETSDITLHRKFPLKVVASPRY